MPSLRAFSLGTELNWNNFDSCIASILIHELLLFCKDQSIEWTCLEQKPGKTKYEWCVNIEPKTIELVANTQPLVNRWASILRLNYWNTRTVRHVSHSGWNRVAAGVQNLSCFHVPGLRHLMFFEQGHIETKKISYTYFVSASHGITRILRNYLLAPKNCRFLKDFDMLHQYLLYFNRTYQKSNQILCFKISLFQYPAIKLIFCQQVLPKTVIESKRDTKLFWTLTPQSCRFNGRPFNSSYHCKPRVQF